MKAALAAAASCLLLSMAAHAAGLERRSYGVTAAGEPIEQFSLTNDQGMVVRFLSLGGIITDVEVPDRNGKVENVVLGLPSLADYERTNRNYNFGGILGRYAGRIANARFSIDGREVRLRANDGPNALHGGAGESFIAKLWHVEPLNEPGVAGAVLRYSSPDGEQNFPGRLDVAVTYRLLPGNALRIDYEAQSDAPTVLNLTNHSYFNLAGANAGAVFAHRMQIYADHIVLTDESGVPTGALGTVAGTPFDFRELSPIGDCGTGEMPWLGGYCGYNHSWLLRNEGEGPRLALRLAEPESGRVLEVLTTEPSIHVYTANHASGQDMGAAGLPLRSHHGVALETQHLPDSPNQPEFPSTLLRPGDTFRSTTIYRFSTDGSND